MSYAKMTNELRNLVKRERQLLNSLAGTERFLTSYEPSLHKLQISCRLRVLESMYSEFFEVRRKTELILDEIAVSSESTDAADESSDVKPDADEEQQKKNLQILSDFEDRFFNAKAGLLKVLEKGAVESTAADDHSSQGAAFPKVKLPEIKLPTFSGKVRDWITFRDSFCSLIDSNTQLMEIDKFNYLRSSLSGEALQEISSVELSAANYSVAWQALQARYENKKLIVKAHIDALFAVDGLKRENYDGLNHLISEFEKNLQMLDKIGEKTAEWSTLLVHMVCSRLDPATLRNWETHHNSKDVPTYQNLISFLRNHCAILQSVAPVVPFKSSHADQRSSKQAVCQTVVKSAGRCLFCNETWHSAFHCARFQRMKVAERNEAVAKAKLCRNCLYPGHYARTCERGLCRHCHQKHHSMLHGGETRSSVPHSQSRPSTQPRQQQQPQSKSAQSNQQTQNTNTATSANSQNTHTQSATEQTATTSQNLVSLPVTPTQNILLSTALVKIHDRFGKSMLARALLDSCSQHCLMTKSFSTKLNFRESPSYLSVQGIGPSQSVSTKAVTALVGPRSSTVSEYVEEMEFHVLPKLTISLPTAAVNPSGWNLPQSMILADPHFHEPGPIDLIIGAEYYMDLLRDDRQKATNDGPTLQSTVFGWIVSGRVPDKSLHGPVSLAHVCSTAEIQDQLTRFWELETCRTTSTHSTEESACEEIFDKTTVRDEEGRFVVTLPKKEHLISQLGESRSIAIRRFIGIERRFVSNLALKEEYTKFIREYEAMGHMEEISGETAEGKEYYLPHHAVLKPDSTTTKLRVVFDASCRTSSGVSLNEALMVGPVVQDDIQDISLRFRLHRYALVGDVAKMYRMVLHHKDDRRFLKIVWRNDPSEPIRTYQLKTVTYGTASAPYLATKCLQRLSEVGESAYPVAARVVRKDFYVDDMLSGADTLEEGKILIREMIALLQSAGFTLRKWNSNSSELLKNVPEDLRDGRSILELESANTTVKTLGLMWEPCSDQFKFSTPTWNPSSIITKRSVLSDASRLFDPLGLVGPVIVQAKIFIQDLWRKQCGWDEPLDENLQEQWREYKRNLAGLDSLAIPRWVGFSRSVVAVEFHGFCDASNKAYGACIYLRSVSETGEVSVHLLTAKSRVAPLNNLKKAEKHETTPRLELSSALLLAHLFEKVRNALHLDARTFFWTDSMIVKCWLSSSPSRWKQFVANRVSEIQHITRGGVWSHVAGLENPADIISRGMTPAQLQYEKVWFHGPCWLQLEEKHWPNDQRVQEDEIQKEVLEEKSVTAVLPAVTPSEIFSWRSSLMDLVRIVVYIDRFRSNARRESRNSRRAGAVTSQEIDATLKTLVRISQKESFPQEIADLTNNREVRETSKIIRLHPKMIDGIVCVGGRLRHADISASRKHPYIIDHRHPLAKLIVVYYHRKHLHAGQQLLISAMRERFWITNARNLVRSVLHECVPCFRVRPQVHEQLMADLPPERVTPCFPFQRVGVDYCGPFMIKYPQRRAQPIKCFVAIYVCLVTKAVHLELAADLSTQGFLTTFKRFVARRGKPQIVMCDNAKNFVGARRELAEIHNLVKSRDFQNSVVQNAAEERIEFKFIPARSPNFGGLWESAVKSFKTLLKRSIGVRVLTYDEMQTMIVQIEAVLNSRPLTPLSNDPDDFEALTPGHFLIQRPLTALPEPALDGVPDNRLSTWQRIEQIMQRIWQKWSTQYLSDLHNRTKWTKRKDNIAVGTMVVLKEDNIPPLKWPLARVTEIHAGVDGNVRVVTVRTKDGSYRRAISKICILPIRDNTNSPAEEN